MRLPGSYLPSSRWVRKLHIELVFQRCVKRNPVDAITTPLRLLAFLHAIAALSRDVSAFASFGC
jgi:hypothetical protein